MEVVVSWFGEGSSWLRGQNFTPARGMSLCSATKTVSLSLLLCHMPVGVGMHLPFKMTMQEPIVCVLSKITCNFTESWRSHVGHSLEMCLEMALQATGHQQAHWCTPGGMAPDPLSNHLAAHQGHEVLLSCISCSKWRPYLLLRPLWNWYTDPYQTQSKVQIMWLI